MSEVLEIGAGTGANAAFYPPSVTRLVLSEPGAHMRAKLEAKLGPNFFAVRSNDIATCALPIRAT